MGTGRAGCLYRYVFLGKFLHHIDHSFDNESMPNLSFKNIALMQATESDTRIFKMGGVDAWRSSIIRKSSPLVTMAL